MLRRIFDPYLLNLVAVKICVPKQTSICTSDVDIEMGHYFIIIVATLYPVLPPMSSG